MHHRFTSLAAATLFVLLAGATYGEETKTPRTDLYGDPLPPGAVARMGTIRLRHAGSSVVFSKDGKRLISCDRQGEVRTWEVATGKLVGRQWLASKLREQNRFRNVFLSPDGTTVAAWDGNTAHLYDTATGKKRCQVPANPGGNEPILTFSADGNILAVQRRDNGGLDQELWDVKEGKKRQTLETPTLYNVPHVAFAPDGKCLAGTVHDGYVSGRIHLWDTSTGKEIRKGNPSILAQCMVFSADGKTLAVGSTSRGEVWLLDAATLREKTRLKQPKDVGLGLIDRLAFSPDGRLLAGTSSESYGKVLLIWSLDGSKQTRQLLGRFHSWFAFAPDGKRLAGYDASGSEISLWDVASGRQLHLRSGHAQSVRTLAASTDGKLIVSGDIVRPWRLWDAASGKPLHELWCDEDDLLHACLFGPHGKNILEASHPGILRMWDVATGKERRRFKIKGYDCDLTVFHAVAISADGKRLMVVASDGANADSGRLLVWDQATDKQWLQRSYQCWKRFRPMSCMPWIEDFSHAAFAPDGDRVTVWLGDRMGIAEIATARLLATLPKDARGPIQFSPDGWLVAAPNGERKLPRTGVGCLSLIEAASGEEVVRLEIGEFTHTAFTPDSRALVVADSQKLSVWDTSTGERLHQMQWPECIRDRYGKAEVDSLAVLPEGRAATGMTEGEILVWDLAPSIWSKPKPKPDLGRKELDALWSNLAGDVRRAQRALHTLTATHAQTVPFLRERLHPAVEVDGKRIDQWLVDLDSDIFSTREAASRALAGLCDLIESRLRHALKSRPSLEMRRRLENILAEPRRPSAERLRMLRAIAVLERIGTQEARHLLEKLSGGAATPETRAAQAALRRLSAP